HGRAGCSPGTMPRISRTSRARGETLRTCLLQMSAALLEIDQTTLDLTQLLCICFVMQRGELLAELLFLRFDPHRQETPYPFSRNQRRNVASRPRSFIITVRIWQFRIRVESEPADHRTNLVVGCLFDHLRQR